MSQILAAREVLGSIRVRFWYHLLLHHVGRGSKTELNLAFDPDADPIGGTDKRIVRWEKGEHVPQPATIGKADVLLPGSMAIILHPVWRALSGPSDMGMSPFEGIRHVGQQRPLYFPGMWVPLQGLVERGARFRMLNGDRPEMPEGAAQGLPLDASASVADVEAWLDYLFANLVMFDQSALGFAEDRALEALWASRRALSALLRMSALESLADSLYDYLNEQYPLDWLLCMYCSNAEKRSGRYLEMAEEGWRPARV